MVNKINYYTSERRLVIQWTEMLYLFCICLPFTILFLYLPFISLLGIMFGGMFAIWTGKNKRLPWESFLTKQDLENAAQKGDVALLDQYLAIDNVLRNYDAELRCAFRTAAQYNQAEVMQYLLDKIDIVSDLKTMDSAITLGSEHPSIVKLVLDATKEDQLKSLCKSAFIEGCKYQNEALIRMMLNEYIEHLEDEIVEEAVFEAIETARYKTLRVLLKQVKLSAECERKVKIEANIMTTRIIDSIKVDKLMSHLISVDREKHYQRGTVAKLKTLRVMMQHYSLLGKYMHNLKSIVLYRLKPQESWKYIYAFPGLVEYITWTDRRGQKEIIQRTVLVNPQLKQLRNQFVSAYIRFRTLQGTLPSEIWTKIMYEVAKKEGILAPTLASRVITHVSSKELVTQDIVRTMCFYGQTGKRTLGKELLAHWD